ncbi:LPXTG cell wall anchor domain-containing protein [Streptomyces sp. NPDC102360]|uniref:LPXTG cell wall anchor domain-containing protein n=1 Tax=Streptomyces sp. NPDC102360 TaxID=3366160 RepID=UPI00381CF5F7
MQIRQILATAAVAAVTAPVALLSVSPAYAGTSSTVQSQEQSSIAELKQAVKEAKKAYKAALAAKDELIQELKDTELPTNPVKAALDSAQKAADEAATVKTTADEAVKTAQAKLDALKADEAATAEEKDAAQKALDQATTAATDADATKTDADAKLTKATEAYNNLRIGITKKISQADNDIEAARTALKTAKKALADAKDEEPGPVDPADPGCTDGTDLKASLSGLPSKIAAGSSVDFKLRLTNTTKKTLDEVLPFVAVGAVDKSGEKDISSKLHLKSKQDGAWKTVDQESYAGEFTNVKAGAHVDLPLRLTIDRSTPAGYGASLAVGEYFNQDESCGTSDLAVYEFTINPVGAGNSDTPAGEGNKPKPQGSASPVANSGSGNGSADTDGSLATTGSSSALPTIGLAGGAAVLLGAGAVYVVRRRKADANS